MTEDVKGKADNYDLLAIAIVEKAVEDYRREFVIASRRNEKTPLQKSIERFLRSEWGEALSFGRGEYIIERLQKELDDYLKGVS